MRVLLLALLPLVAPLVAAEAACVGDACAEAESASAGGHGLRCNGAYQTGTHHAAVWIGEGAWLVVTQRCENRAGWGNGYDYVGAGIGGQAFELLWWQEGYEETWRCDTFVAGASLGCPLGPPITLP